MKLALEHQIVPDILARLGVARVDPFIPEADRPDQRFGRFSADGTPRLSPSQVNTLRMCPARWKHQYLDGRPSPGSYQAVVGTIGHAAMEAALGTIQDPIGPRALEEATRVAAEVHLSDPKSLADTMNGHAARIQPLVDGIAAAVRRTWDWLLMHDVEVLGIEERTTGRYHHDIDVDSLSYVDARLVIDGQERIIDWKFPGRRPWRVGGQVQARDSYCLAMQMYGDAYLRQGTEIDEAWIVHASLEGGVDVARQHIDDTSLEASRRKVRGAIGRVLSGRLGPDRDAPGPLCSRQWCPYYDTCPAT